MNKAKTTNRVLLAALIVCNFGATASPQQPKPYIGKEGVLLSKDKPTIYISFERAGERKPVYAEESNRGVWLRLHNNTRWAINFCTQSLYIGKKLTPFLLGNGRRMLGLRDDIEVNMCHGVEQVDYYDSYTTPEGAMVIDESVKVPNPPVGYDRGHVSSSAWLPAGGSVIFSVPREHLAKRLAVYIAFNYEWEFGEHGVRSNEPEHRVSFRAADLPEGRKQ